MGWMWQQALKIRSKLYCMCRKPYNKDQAMIACDQGSEWYHYNCLGLAEPESERRKEGRAAQRDAAEFVCPDCEQAQHMGSREPARDVGAPRFHEKKTEEHHCASEVPPAPVTPEAPKEVGVPQAELRRKTSSHAKTKAIVQPKWQKNHVLMSNDHTSSSSKAEMPTSGRPCRRTVGRHSGFSKKKWSNL